MGDAGGHCALPDAVSLGVANGKVAGVVVSLGHSHFHNVLRGVNTAGQAAAFTHNGAGLHADHGSFALGAQRVYCHFRHVEGVFNGLQNVRIHLRLRQGYVRAVPHTLAALKHLLHMEVLKIAQHGEICQISRGDCTLVVQKEISRSPVTGNLHRQNGIRAQGYRLAANVVNVPFF